LGRVIYSTPHITSLVVTCRILHHSQLQRPRSRALFFKACVKILLTTRPSLSTKGECSPGDFPLLVRSFSVFHVRLGTTSRNQAITFPARLETRCTFAADSTAAAERYGILGSYTLESKHNKEKIQRSLLSIPPSEPANSAAITLLVGFYVIRRQAYHFRVGVPGGLIAFASSLAGPLIP
jgi:hypothetical protein